MKTNLKLQIKKHIHRFAPVYHYFYNRMKALPDMPLGHYLSIVACVKNESRYLREWIEYHLWAGIGHFYLYDNGSTDNTRDILDPYIQRGIVTYHNGNNQQIREYEDAVIRYGRCTRWMALIDADEFITLTREGKRQFGAGGRVVGYQFL